MACCASIPGRIANGSVGFFGGLGELFGGSGGLLGGSVGLFGGCGQCCHDIFDIMNTNEHIGILGKK